MRYLGGKNRMAKYIARILQEYSNGVEQYVEPFVGSAAVAERLRKDGFDLPMILADAAPDLILLYRALQNGYIPPGFISEVFYETAKSFAPSPIRGFVGYGCSWGGKFFGGYARGEDRNYANESRNSLLKTITALNKARFVLSDYRSLNIDKPSLVYCDPPYADTTRYDAIGGFCHEEFWNWVRMISRNGHSVIVSEYQAPSDFEAIWEKNHMTSVRPKMGNETRIEKLFKLSTPILL